MTIHILSDRRLPISNSPVAAVPLLPRSGFVQCADSRVSPYALLVEDIEGHAADANDPPERTQSEWRRTVCLFLLGSKGSVLMKEHGLSLTHPQLAGQDMSVPKAIRSLLGPAL